MSMLIMNFSGYLMLRCLTSEFSLLFCVSVPDTLFPVFVHLLEKHS